jgi:hypothetical protein
MTAMNQKLNDTTEGILFTLTNYKKKKNRINFQVKRILYECWNLKYFLTFAV